MRAGMTGLQPGQLTIRPARVGDAGAMALVHVTAWQQAYRGLLSGEYLASLTVPGAEAGWRDTLTAERGSTRYLVAESPDGVVLAMAAVGSPRERDAPAGLGELQMINVDPRWWGAGVGTALLLRAEQELRTMSYTGAYLWVLEGNRRAERFYRRCGWQETEVRRNDQRIAGSPREIKYVRELRGLRGRVGARSRAGAGAGMPRGLRSSLQTGLLTGWRGLPGKGRAPYRKG